MLLAGGEEACQREYGRTEYAFCHSSRSSYICVVCGRVSCRVFRWPLVGEPEHIHRPVGAPLPMDDLLALLVFCRSE